MSMFQYQALFEKKRKDVGLLSEKSVSKFEQYRIGEHTGCMFGTCTACTGGHVDHKRVKLAESTKDRRTSKDPV